VTKIDELFYTTAAPTGIYIFSKTVFFPLFFFSTARIVPDWRESSKFLIRIIATRRDCGREPQCTCSETRHYSQLNFRTNPSTYRKTLASFKPIDRTYRSPPIKSSPLSLLAAFTTRAVQWLPYIYILLILLQFTRE
jgi:hypothetical protein